MRQKKKRMRKRGPGLSALLSSWCEGFQNVQLEQQAAVLLHRMVGVASLLLPCCWSDGVFSKYL